MSVLVGHTSVTSTSGTTMTTPPLDTTGTTALFMIGYAVFGVFTPVDSYGNTWVLEANPAASCNGGMSLFRCFNPICGPGHTGTLTGDATYSKQMVMLALRPVDPTGSWALRRLQAASGVDPIQPTVFSPAAPSNTDYVIITCGMAGCGFSTVAVDSGFTLLEALAELGVAYQILASPNPTLNPTWTTIGMAGGTGAAIMEGMGVYTSLIALTCPPATTGTVGSPYSSSIGVTGATGSVTFSITSGSLPTGLTLNASTGLISGTPTASGTFIFNAYVIDSAGNADNQLCSITISVGPPVPSCPPLASINILNAYSSATGVLGGTSPFTFSISAGSLPPGLSINASTGVVSGTPLVVGIYNFTIHVVDADSLSGNIPCTITVTSGGVYPPIRPARFCTSAI
jgi:hypothetical protein